jgi:hypothetical protein
MAYDEDLANRIRARLADEPVTEKAMFGGLAFLLNGHMCVSASGRGGLLARVDPVAGDEALSEPHASRAQPSPRGTTTTGAAARRLRRAATPPSSTRRTGP